MTAQITKTEIQQFVELITSISASIVEAGRFLCSMIDRDPEAIEKIVKARPEYSEEILRRFERVGRGQLSPRLTWLDRPAVKYLRKLPVELQEKYLSTPVEVYIEGGEFLNIDVLNLEREQADQVFEKDGSQRSIAAQRAYREAKTPRAVIAQMEKPYKVMRGRVNINGIVFTCSQLAQILAEASE